MRAIIDRSRLVAALALVACLAVQGCSGGTDGGAAVVLPAVTPTALTRDDPSPRLVVTISNVRGGGGPHGSFRPGDRVTVDYTLTKTNGAPWRLDEMSTGNALVSGPTFDYQRVVAEQQDVVARSTNEANGTHSYTFAVPLPETYLAPYNDTSSFGPLDGELTGRPLLDGTYTVGLTFAWSYTVDGAPFVASGEATADLLIGDTAIASPRAVTGQAQCDRCHVELRAHDGLHSNVTMCLLCHTSGAEDANDPDVAGGTPGVSVDSRVLFHQLHNGSHLQSVLGIGFTSAGAMDYTLPTRPYLVADASGEVHDYSSVRFPAWPNRSIPMPPVFGYGSLTPEAKAKDDQMRKGVTSCDACHGDPDGSGPIQAPAQGGIAWAQPSRRACAACHDGVDFSHSTIISLQEMPPQPDDSLCTTCHTVQGGPLAVRDLHRHPLDDRITEPHAPFEVAFNEGLNVTSLGAVEGPGADHDGTIDPGERISVSFDLKDDAGVAVSASTVGTIHATVSGPTVNSNLILDVDVPRARFTGPPPYTSTLPAQVLFEYVGRSSANLGDVFTTRSAPHWNVTGAPTRVRVRTGTTSVASALASAAPGGRNFVDVVDASGFHRDDFVVIDDGVFGGEEYLRLQFVEGDRLWFSSPASPAYAFALRSPHPAGASIAVVTLANRTQGVDYALDTSTGTVTELIEFGDARAVLVDYVTDFRFPVRYPLPANDSPDLDEAWGEWAGKSIVSGTYRVSLSASVDKTFFGAGVQRVYTIASPSAVTNVLVGSALVEQPHAVVANGAACEACHQQLMFHGGRSRGFDSCIVCHGNAGAEDRARYVAANAPASPGATIDFRTMLHAVHRGSDLSGAADFTLVDAGSSPYPGNFVAETFEHVVYPAIPGKTAQCAKCHGPDNAAWKLPARRDHPTESTAPVQAWRSVCSACHDSPASAAHRADHTSTAGVESCDACHGVGQPESVERVHRVR